EHSAEPPVVHVILAAPFGGLGNRLLRLALGADQQDTTAAGHDVADCLQPLVQHRLGLLEVNDMDPVSDAEEVGRHLGVPSAGGGGGKKDGLGQRGGCGGGESA